MASHVHFGQWCLLAGLVNDGAVFVRGGMKKPAGGGGGGARFLLKRMQCCIGLGVLQ